MDYEHEKRLVINFGAVFLSIILSLLIFAFWSYNFRGIWLQEAGITDEFANRNLSPWPYILTGVYVIVSSILLAWLFKSMKVESIGKGMLITGLLALVFIMTPIIISNSYAFESLKLSLLESISYLAMALVTGIILSSWKKYR